MRGKHDPVLRKQMMLAKARELFWKNGYDGTSIRDIAKAYGCKPANIYNYFPTKKDILYEILLEGHEQLIKGAEKLMAVHGLDPLEKLRSIIKIQVKVILREKRSGKMLMDSDLVHLPPAKKKTIIGIRDAYERLLIRVVQENIDRGTFSTTNVKLAVFMLSSMINRTRLWFSTRGELSEDGIGEFIFELIVNGLRGKGRGQKSNYSK